MRILVTGAGNPFGRAIVRALVKRGDRVRIFGDGPESAAPFEGLGPGSVAWYPGDVASAGSIEPALSERQALVHASGLDVATTDRKRDRIHIESGARYARYGAEREQVDDFVLVTPAQPERAFVKAHEAAIREVALLRGTIQHAIVTAKDPDSAASEVAALLGRLPELGKQPGRETDAVTA
ncbi:MAG: Rossmann-fold NAD(P)-binding domain-containing protein [Thermoplasmatota archaeon]